MFERMTHDAFQNTKQTTIASNPLETGFYKFEKKYITFTLIYSLYVKHQRTLECGRKSFQNRPKYLSFNVYFGNFCARTWGSVSA